MFLHGGEQLDKEFEGHVYAVWGPGGIRCLWDPRTNGSLDKGTAMELQSGSFLKVLIHEQVSDPGIATILRKCGECMCQLWGSKILGPRVRGWKEIITKAVRTRK